jgi:hypothetical protein
VADFAYGKCKNNKWQKQNKKLSAEKTVFAATNYFNDEDAEITSAIVLSQCYYQQG